jgi:glycosyltransferase involved in cell wall biosynthesis
MRVAIDTNCILPGRVGGIENYTLGLIEALKRPGSPTAELVLLTRTENHDLFARFLDARTAVVRVERPLHQGQPVTNWAALLAEHPVTSRRALEQYQHRKADLLRKLGVTLVHFPGNTVNPLDLDLPVVLNLHDLQHRHFPQYFTPQEVENRELWWRRSAERADALVAASNYVRDDLHAQWHVDPSRVFVTPDPFEAAFAAAPSPERLVELRARLALPETFFIYPAAAWPHKNHERLVRAFAAADLPEAQLVLTGGGHVEGSGAVARAVAASELGSRVRLLGRVSTDDLVGLYHLATALIFPSQHESWSIPVMEAMACGCPVACSDVTSLPEEVGDAGLLFAPDDVDAMAAAMRRVAGDAAQRQELSIRGRERVKQFSPDRFVRAIAAAYEHAVAAHRARQAA